MPSLILGPLLRYVSDDGDRVTLRIEKTVPGDWRRPRIETLARARARSGTSRFAVGWYRG